VGASRGGVTCVAGGRGRRTCPSQQVAWLWVACGGMLHGCVPHCQRSVQDCPRTCLHPRAQMEDVQWYDKAELRAAVQLYDGGGAAALAAAAAADREAEAEAAADAPLSVAQLQVGALPCA
jgi:hypothetical protein